MLGTRVGNLHANKIDISLGSQSFRFIAHQLPREEDAGEFLDILQEGETWIDLHNIASLDATEPPSLSEKSRGKKHVGLFEISDLTISVKGRSEQKKVLRCNYKIWPDYSSISVEDLKKLVSEVEPFYNVAILQPQRRLWVNCRAGVGRTGTLIAAYVLKQGIMNGAINTKNLVEKLNQIILAMREQRSIMMVETEFQYKSLFDTALSWLEEKSRS